MDDDAGRAVGAPRRACVRGGGRRHQLRVDAVMRVQTPSAHVSCGRTGTAPRRVDALGGVPRWLTGGEYKSRVRAARRGAERAAQCSPRRLCRPRRLFVRRQAMVR
eukprot:scaffold3713_cov372-Prasinococcus_capsulatus_cf.AAC.9